MDLFQITSTDTFQGPHQSLSPLETGALSSEVQLGMVMIHGRGASAQSILSLSGEIDARDKITFIAPRAQGHTWYPYSFLAPTQKNQPGLNSGLQAVYNAVHQLVESGIPKNKIIILGFSQGACLASEFAARHPAKYGGIIALSGGVIGETVEIKRYSGDLKQTPYFVGCSDIDPHIPLERVEESARVFEHLNAKVEKRIYPGMGHTVNEDEIAFLNDLIHSMID